MPYYNLTGIVTNSTTMVGFMQGVNNTLMFGWLGVAFLIGFSVILFTSFLYSTQDAHKAFGATGFISFTLTLLLMGMGLISNPIVLFITLSCCAGAIAIGFKR
jgi:formate hydrogenlyase subunit 3/multisubunit Na+/H+ antiporter MnhD subunit|tara:strand:- start:736 stop:1044 length:309 start_codon:yes stop_codon:yes gene_type:complete